MTPMRLTYPAILEPSEFQLCANVTKPQLTDIHFTAVPTEYKIEIWINNIMCDGSDVLPDLTHAAEKKRTEELRSYYLNLVLRGRESEIGA